MDTTTVKTLQTGALVFNTDRTDSLLTVNYYDKRARLVQRISKNHLGGIDNIQNEYNFSEDILKTTHTHTGSSSGTTLTSVTRNVYDHMGRLKDVRHKIGTSDTVTIQSLSCNEIGQLKQVFKSIITIFHNYKQKP